VADREVEAPAAAEIAQPAAANKLAETVVASAEPEPAKAPPSQPATEADPVSRKPSPATETADSKESSSGESDSSRASNDPREVKRREREAELQAQGILPK
jgi:ribonuclease E